MKELEDVNEWLPFGLYLRIKLSKLEAIKVECPVLRERRMQMLIEWQKNGTPTWTSVVQALDGIGMGRLASELAQKHGWLNEVFHTIVIRLVNLCCHYCRSSSSKAVR